MRKKELARKITCWMTLGIFHCSRLLLLPPTSSPTPPLPKRSVPM